MVATKVTPHQQVPSQTAPSPTTADNWQNDTLSQLSDVQDMMASYVAAANTAEVNDWDSLDFDADGLFYCEDGGSYSADNDISINNSHGSSNSSGSSSGSNVYVANVVAHTTVPLSPVLTQQTVTQEMLNALFDTQMATVSQMMQHVSTQDVDDVVMSW